MVLKILKNIGKSILFFISVLLLLLLVTFGFTFYSSYSAKKFKYLEPQPRYLLTIEETRSEQKSYFFITANADLKMDCSNRFQFKVPSSGSYDKTIVINMDGLYQRETLICHRDEWPRFSKYFFKDGPVTKQPGDVINLFVMLRGSEDEYQLKTSTDGKSIISPQSGSFSEIVAYYYNGKLEWETVKHLNTD